MNSINSSPDAFRPRCDPGRSIYDALTAEQSRRKDRPFEEWNKAEIAAVHVAAVEAFARANLPEPTLAEVESAERYASGSVDYGATWIFALTKAVADRMKAAACNVITSAVQ